MAMECYIRSVPINERADHIFVHTDAQMACVPRLIQALENIQTLLSHLGM